MSLGRLSTLQRTRQSSQMTQPPSFLVPPSQLPPKWNQVLMTKGHSLTSTQPPMTKPRTTKEIRSQEPFTDLDGSGQGFAACYVPFDC